jgi:RNA polymerase sigma-70 factor (ECF subfamily)
MQPSVADSQFMADNQSASGGARTVNTAEVEQFRGYLMRYALLQLRDQTAAEDVVQETLLAAVQGVDRFSGRSSVKTWLTGILKHKVVDQVRRQSRERPLIQSEEDDRSEAEIADALFKADGHWQIVPANWGDPANALESKQFWDIFEMCAKLMPVRTARVFMMREVMELSTEEICKELDITTTNCWVMLHRARLSLRECLQIKWFGRA